MIEKINTTLQRDFFLLDETILLVDDNPDMRELGKEYLMLQNYRVRLAKSGKEALKIATQYKVDLILLDIQMPIWDGFKTLHALRQADVTVPIIALTGRSTPEDRDKCLQSGFDDYLSKPYKLDECSTTLKKYLPLH